MLPSLPAESAIGAAQRVAVETRLRGQARLLARVGWLGVAVVTAGLFVTSVALQLGAIHRLCPTPACVTAPLPPVELEAAHELGLPVVVVLSLNPALTLLVALVYGAVAVLLFTRKPDERMALLVSLALLLFGCATFTGALAILPLRYPVLRLPVAAINFLGSAAFTLFLYAFPDGRLVPRWTRWAAIAWLIQQFPHFVFPGTPLDTATWPPLVSVALWAALMGSVVYAQTVRYQRISTEAQRQQTKWVILGIGVGFVGFLAGSAVQFAVGTRGAHAAPSTGAALEVSLVAGTLGELAMLIIPVSIAIAMLRYRLFDVDVLLNRTLVYAALTACVVGLYVVIVSALSLAFQVRANPGISLLATGAVAVLFQPLRERLQRSVNRLLYGRRDEPYAVLSQLAQRLEATVVPDAVLPTIVETVAGALKLPYAALALADGAAFNVAASVGSPRDDLLRLPLVYQGETVGELRLAPRAPGEPFTPADRKLLQDLAREAGVAVHAVRLTADLRRLTRDLQASRVQLITAREEERRRLRRDLHDGLGSALTSMTFKLGAAENLLAHDPVAVEQLLGELKGQTQAAIADIRHLVYGLRPPALDELGLVTALREYAGHYQLDGVEVSVEAPEALPSLSAATELAAYRIALEALANVARHACATTCTIRLRIVGDALALEIADDGVGLPADAHAGVGLTAMRERAVELGGSCAIMRGIDGGTCVSARLPLG
jgi:signal transduction histidine kinase